MAGLFAATFHLNRRAYTTSISTVALAFDQTLDQQKALLQQHIEQEESRLFALAETDRILETDLFLNRGSAFIPACVENLTKSIPRNRGGRGLPKRRRSVARSRGAGFFKIATQSPIETPEGLYTRISALFNLLDFNPRAPRVICSISFLLKQNPVTMAESRTLFFKSMLTERVANLETIETRLEELSKNGRGSLSKNKHPKRPVPHSVQRSRVFPFERDGLALLHSPDLPTIPSIQITTKPSGLNRALMTGLYISVADEVLEREKRRIHEQYRGGQRHPRAASSTRRASDVRRRSRG